MTICSLSLVRLQLSNEAPEPAAHRPEPCTGLICLIRALERIEACAKPSRRRRQSHGGEEPVKLVAELFVDRESYFLAEGRVRADQGSHRSRGVIGWNRRCCRIDCALQPQEAPYVCPHEMSIYAEESGTASSAWGSRRVSGRVRPSSRAHQDGHSAVPRIDSPTRARAQRERAHAGCSDARSAP